MNLMELLQLQDMFNIGSLRLPHKLAEKLKHRCGIPCEDQIGLSELNLQIKHKHNENEDISDHAKNRINLLDQELLPEDIRQLIKSEEEMLNKGHYERIFPAENSEKYLKYFARPRYFNQLLINWEKRYAKKRDLGITLLKELSRNKLHLM